jgi:dsRNA-specific ribonuclease
MIEEMERLSFVGTSAITLCTVLYLTITDKFKMNEKIMDLKKNMIIEKTNISRKGKDMGFHR